MILLSYRYPFIGVTFKWKKQKKYIKNRKLKQKINNNQFLLKFDNTAFDVIFVRVIFSMLGAFSYNFENKEKHYLHLWSTEGQWLKKLFVRIFFLF